MFEKKAVHKLIDIYRRDFFPTSPAYQTFVARLLPDLKARGKTALVISHDDRYCHVPDRITKLNYGQVESDTLAAPRAPRVLP